MTLNQKVKTMEAETGIIPMLCTESECLHRYVSYKAGYHCPDEIPYVKRMGEAIKILSLCQYKIEQYFIK